MERGNQKLLNATGRGYGGHRRRKQHVRWVVTARRTTGKVEREKVLGEKNEKDNQEVVCRRLAPKRSRWKKG